MNDFFVKPLSRQSVITEIEHRARKNAVDYYSSFGPSANLVFNETPAGAVNGSNVTFTTTNNFAPGSLLLSVNGLEQTYGVDFTTIGNNTIQMTESPETGDVIRVFYVKE